MDLPRQVSPIHKTFMLKPPSMWQKTSSLTLHSMFPLQPASDQRHHSTLMSARVLRRVEFDCGRGVPSEARARTRAEEWKSIAMGWQIVD